VGMMAEINPLYPITELTQAQYDALGVKDANTLYAIPFDGVPPSHQRPTPGSTLPCALITQADYESLGTYDGNTLYCIPYYDETKIAVVLLDENAELTDDVAYFETIADSSTYLKDNAANRYLVHIGELTGISTIGNAAYNSCTALRRINLPDSITEIRFGAFYATSLTEITIPNSVTSMSEQPFANCTSLTRAVLPNSITAIPYLCFAGCTLLNDIAIPDSVTGINNFAFDECTSLTSISIPSSVSAIGPYGFYRCTNITFIIDKPEGSISGGSAPWGATNATVIWTG